LLHFIQVQAKHRVVFLLGALALALLAAQPAEAEKAPRQVGLMADMGVPDGMIGAIAVRPNAHIAVHAGGGYNSLSPGLRAGVQVYALKGGVSPYVAMEAGHYFAGAANDMAQELALKAGMDGDVTLQELGYSFANGHLGLTLGGDSAAVYLQAGLSMVRTRAEVRETRGLEMAPTATVDVVTQSVFQLWTPSGRVGLIAYF
jgi:hypothetical protein